MYNRKILEFNEKIEYYLSIMLYQLQDKTLRTIKFQDDFSIHQAYERDYH